jgi:hypothetical protein
MTYEEFITRPDFLTESPELKMALMEVAEIVEACRLRLGVSRYDMPEVMKMAELVMQRANMVAFAEEERRNDE